MNKKIKTSSLSVLAALLLIPVIPVSADTGNGLTFLGEVTEPSGDICVYQEETLGEGNFALLGSVGAFDHSAETAEEAYNYDGSYAGTSPEAISNISQLFFANTSEGGVSLFIVHDAVNDTHGGRVDLLLTLTGDDADVLLADERREIVEGPDNTFTASHKWRDCCTDGGVIGTLEGEWSILVDSDFASGIHDWQVTAVSGPPIILGQTRQVRLEPCEEEVVELLSKTIINGPDMDQDGEIDAIIAVKQTQTAEYTWQISYNGPEGLDADITDVAPAEFVVLVINADASELPLDCGEETSFDDESGAVDVYRGGKVGKNCQSSTGLTWLPSSNQETLEVTVAMRESPGGGHEQPAFSPTSCGALYLNDGAVADLYDPVTGELATDPDSGEPLAPLISNQLCIAAVESPTEYGFDADNDGDNLSDYDEACVNDVRTNPCSADTDGDGVNDDVDSCPVDYNTGVDTDLDGIDNVCDEDDDGDGTPDVEDICPLDPDDAC